MEFGRIKIGGLRKILLKMYPDKIQIHESVSLVSSDTDHLVRQFTIFRNTHDGQGIVLTSDIA